MPTSNFFEKNSDTEWQAVQISWPLQKPTDLDLHNLQRQCISGFSRTRVNVCHFVFKANLIQKTAGLAIKKSIKFQVLSRDNNNN